MPAEADLIGEDEEPLAVREIAFAVTMPRGVRAVYAMARPRRPDSERRAVQDAAHGFTGSARRRAALIANRVLELAMADIDGETEAHLSALLRTAANPSIYELATSPEIDTAAIIRSARARRLEARGGRRLPEREWAAEDRSVLRECVARLAERYERHLQKICS